MDGDQMSFFEGCGREGPIRCIFFCEFHPTAGPKITFQVPEDYVSKEIFDSVCVYLIPKPQLQRSILTVNVLGHKITGFPVRIDSSKYERNAYYFNLCFVCDAWARTIQYESVIKKMSEYLITMELENGFLSNENQNQKSIKLLSIFKKILHDLNSKKFCTIADSTPTIHLKVVNISADPPVVADHHVPIFIVDEEYFQGEHWDLTTHQVLPFIDGFNHVAKIASEADVENNLVKACIQNLLYYGIVHIIPIFQYNNMYSTTPLLRKLYENKEMQDECIQYVCKSENHLPKLRDIFQFYCNMTYGITLKDLCIRFNSAIVKIDIRKLVQYGLLNGLIRRIHKYPVMISDYNFSQASSLYQNFSGLCSYDEICCSTGLTTLQLEEIVDSNPSIYPVWK